VLAENADLTCRLITDEYVGYQSVGKAFTGGHEAVKHAKRLEYRQSVESPPYFVPTAPKQADAPFRE